MARQAEFVAPGQVFSNWAELSTTAKKLLEEDQYRKQLYASTYGD